MFPDEPVVGLDQAEKNHEGLCDTVGEVGGVRGAQLCKTGKAGAASFVAVWARNIKDGPAP